jgi:putative hydrolase of the HAD superfamily
MASVQWRKIISLGLDKRVDKIIVTDDLGRDFWKPNKHFFEEMLKHFALLGEEAVYVGDNPIKDFIGAREAGYKTIRIVRDLGDYMKLQADRNYEADYKIDDLRKLIDLI